MTRKVQKILRYSLSAFFMLCVCVLAAAAHVHSERTHTVRFRLGFFLFFVASLTFSLIVSNHSTMQLIYRLHFVVDGTCVRACLYKLNRFDDSVSCDTAGKKGGE